MRFMTTSEGIICPEVVLGVRVLRLGGCFRNWRKPRPEEVTVVTSLFTANWFFLRHPFLLGSSSRQTLTIFGLIRGFLLVYISSVCQAPRRENYLAGIPQIGERLNSRFVAEF
jgi:hypothetical protein